MAQMSGTIEPKRKDEQGATFAFLETGANYGEGVADIERIDTHASIIFLAGKYAYKLKRAVRFSYLDFSTVVLREASCRAELALNGRTAPELYLAVRSITRAKDGTLSFDGSGETIDWVVVMLRFDQGLLFDRMAANGALDDRLMERLSAEIARFHGAAESLPHIGGRASIEMEIAGNAQNLALASPQIFAEDAVSALVASWRVELERYGALLDGRAERGKVRRCHGDLHLRNIVLWHERPTLFDCIEFNEHLSCIDVLYDLAFLLMDLRYRGLAGFANVVFNAYLDRCDETDGIAALPLMMSLRAAIRAHTGVASAQLQVEAGDRQRKLDEAREYLLLSQRLMREERPRLIGIGGLSGTGKSTLARAIAPEIGRVPGARLLHTDALRKRMYGVAKDDRLGAEAYGPAVSERVYRIAREETAATLRAGWSVIVDGVFARVEDRLAIEATARDCGASFTGLWLHAQDDILRVRVTRRRIDMSDATVAVLEKQLQTSLGTIDWPVIDTAKAPADCARLARTALVLP
jgi:aminoglycoside phosphotransferase family enzyme/predicted kinase